MVPMSLLFADIELSECLDDVNYQAVLRFFLLSGSKHRIILIRWGIYVREAFIGNFASICNI